MSTTEDKPEAFQDRRPASDKTGFTENLTETEGFITSSFRLHPDEEYEMNRRRRGLALIFNQQSFHWKLCLNDRRGSDIDCSNLTTRLTGLGFEVRAFTDLKKDEVNDNINKAAEADHSDADCFLLVFMSHGEGDHVYAYDDEVKVKDITDKFKGTKCKSLVGKPKVIIWQACRGDKHDDPVTPCAATDTETTEVVEETRAVYTLPAAADFIMCYSVAEGYYSHRHPFEGSWYIQDLCELLQTYGDSLEFTQLLTMVNRKVSMRSVDKCRDLKAIGKKQVPCFASMLTKKLYFHPKK
ncbi:caspase-6-like [Betta splendens]|uniref:Caspase-6 n=1 Tax=Betta splendens TaxID=158456 RepID=A0A6P7N568_BETSP|nr:caspase-6-like [Betta splendens]